MKVWEDIENRWQNPTEAEIKEYGPRTRDAKDKPFQVREVERDASFLRRYLTEDLIRELNLYEHRSHGRQRVVSRVADKENWREIKETLIQNIGTGTVPTITVEDADYCRNRTLLLKHHHDGRDLHLEYAEKTLDYVGQLWGHDVALETILNDRKSLLSFSDNKLTIKPIA